jgi:SagB-type dehydrogenase family enzyme
MDGQARSSLARLGRILIDSSRQKIPEQYYIHILIYVHRIDGLGTGVYYFDREELTLTLLHDGDVRTHAKFVSCLQDIASDGIFAVSLLADMQSAFEHFGERAYRYVHQEAGFIGQLFYLSARALDIDATGIGCFIDDEINNALPRGMEVVYNFTFGKAVLDPRLTDLPAYDFADPAFASGDEPVN